MSRDACDLLVIGGGINGLGIAADAAARGLSVLLVEKGDFGGGTTSASSRLIHGGLRYLQYGEFGLVRESLRERGVLARKRPHLVRPIRLLIPAYHGARPPWWVVGLGLRLYDLLARDSAFPPSLGLSPEEVARREPALKMEALAGGFVYPDAQLDFPERLCVELFRETTAAGGGALNHTRVTALRCDRGRVSGAVLEDVLGGRTWEVAARLVVNAAGPWVDAVNRLLPEPPPRLIGGTWGTHLVLPRRSTGPAGPVYATARKDGRPFFLLPWDGRLLVGTTDVPFDGDPGEVRMEEWEPDYLLAETNRLFPRAGYHRDDIEFSTIGVRPLPASSRAAGAITRRHFLVDHEGRHGLPGLASVVGGKLTTYRSLAEGVVDWALRRLGREPVPCPTRAGDAAPAPGDERLTRLYGSYAGELRQDIARRPDLGQPLSHGSRAVRAEVVHAVTREAAPTVDDVLLRRLMLLPPTESERAAVAELLRTAEQEVRHSGR